MTSYLLTKINVLGRSLQRIGPRTGLSMSCDRILVDPTLILGNADLHRTNSTSSSAQPPEAAIVYESPLANVVGKLRGVSLMTALVGALGVPAMVALKGTIPDAGMLAVASTFVSGSIGSTAAIHYIFGPYVYSMERIPVRVCSSKNATAEDSRQQMPDEETIQKNVVVDGTTKPTLLKATTKSVFLQRREIVFDPELDVEKYKGLRPMCNLIAKGTPLYVHPGKLECWIM